MKRFTLIALACIALVTQQTKSMHLLRAYQIGSRIKVSHAHRTINTALRTQNTFSSENARKITCIPARAMSIERFFVQPKPQSLAAAHRPYLPSGLVARFFSTSIQYQKPNTITDLEELEIKYNNELRELVLACYKNTHETYSKKDDSYTMIKDNITFKRFCHDEDFEHENMMVIVRIPYFESVESKATASANDSLKFKFVKLLSNLIQIKKALQLYNPSLYESVENFMQAASLIPINNQYTSVGSAPKSAACRKIERSRWLGYGETEREIDCSIWVPVKTFQAIKITRETLHSPIIYENSN